MFGQKFVFSVVALIVVSLIGWLGLTQLRTHSAPPTVKIGLVAPFEGLYRATGYEVLFAVKLAIQERNRGQGLHGYRVELVALNDFNDPLEAEKQARALVADPDIVGVVGHLTAETTQQALPVYQQAGLAVSIPWSVAETAFESETSGFVSVAATVEETQTELQATVQSLGIDKVVTLTDHEVDVSLNPQQAVELASNAVTAGRILLTLPTSAAGTHFRFGQVETGNLQLVQVAGGVANGFIFVSPGPTAAEAPGGVAFSQAYQALSGLSPGPRAIMAYDATHVLLDAIEQATANSSEWLASSPSRAEVSAVIPQIQRVGLSGEIHFSPAGQRFEAPVWLHQITNASYPGKSFYP
ncbi:MAG TPA: ABC transporter substrate-binding protein [Anaerolineae bacterium]|nr:ABC transporter substrate-binding protein [Anaerolineae bacterium]